MTVARVSPVPGSPTVLPPVERRGAIPLGFRAGGLAAGIKASGRPDLAVGRHHVGSGRRGRRLHPEHVRGGARPPLAGAPRGHVGRSAAAASAGPRPSISTSGSANAATGAAGDADQARIAELLADATGAPSSATLHLSTGIIGTRLPLDKVGGRADRDHADARGDRRRPRGRRRSRSGRPIR